MPSLRNLGVVLILAGAASWAQAAPPALKTVDIGGTSVSLQWSPDWQIDAQSTEPSRQSVAFNTADVMKMRALLSAGPAREDLVSDAGLNEVVSRMAAQLQSQSVEKELQIQRLAGANAHGYYVCATDRAPKPDEYKYMCQGVVNVGGTPLAFTVLYNDSGKGEADKVIAAMKTLELAKRT